MQGNDTEIGFFTEQVKKMPEVIVTTALIIERASAKLQGHKCMNESGFELATKFSRLRDAIGGAGK